MSCHEMYNQTSTKPEIRDAACNKCGSNRLLYQRGALKCTNCETIVASSKVRKNKYNAIKTVAKDGMKRDSKFEANVADELYFRKQAGDIKDYESQFLATADIYNENGEKVISKKHKVDFRIHHNDGSYELYEVKGVVTSDYQWRRDIVIGIFLSLNKDHIYTVRTQGGFRK